MVVHPPRVKSGERVHFHNLAPDLKYGRGFCLWGQAVDSRGEASGLRYSYDTKVSRIFENFVPRGLASGNHLKKTHIATATTIISA